MASKLSKLLAATFAEQRATRANRRVNTRGVKPPTTVLMEPCNGSTVEECAERIGAEFDSYFKSIDIGGNLPDDIEARR